MADIINTIHMMPTGFKNEVSNRAEEVNAHIKSIHIVYTSYIILHFKIFEGNYFFNEDVRLVYTSISSVAAINSQHM